MIGVENVSVARSGRLVLSDVSFSVGAGECLVVVGPNGSGKSTLLAAMCGDLAAEGCLRIAGAPVGGKEQSRLRAAMTQQTAVAFGFTVREVIAMGRAPWGDGADESQIHAAASAADVVHLLERRVQGLSGGELARVAFARVLAQDTRVLLLDEPTAALDLRHQVDLLRTVRQRVDEGRAAVIVLHDLTLAAAVADRLLLLDAGVVAALGRPHEVLTSEVLEPVYGTSVDVVPHGERLLVASRW
ncbi:MAG: ATP-binding cassette domain-containing protein [Candidatus Nanopelagicales bacterium]